MSWISGIESGLSGIVSGAEGAITTAATAGHELLGSGGTLTVGNVQIGTGVTQGDVTTANTNVSGALNTNAFTGILTELTSNPLILLAIIAIIVILVMKK